MKEFIYTINQVARQNFEKAQGMLDMFNMIHGTGYGILNRRVVRFENPNASTAEKYTSCHDLYVELD